RRLVGARERDARGQAHDALGAAAPLARFAHLDEAGALQLAQVVVHLLARQTEAARQPARRLRLLEPLEQAEAKRRQRRDGVADVMAAWLESAACHAVQTAGSHLTNNLSIPVAGRCGRTENRKAGAGSAAWEGLGCTSSGHQISRR